MLGGEYGAAIELARWAQSMAETLGVPEPLSDALNTEGCALVGQDQSDAGRDPAAIPSHCKRRGDRD